MTNVVQLRLKHLSVMLDVKKIKHELKISNTVDFKLGELKINGVGNIVATTHKVHIFIDDHENDLLRDMANDYISHGNLNLGDWDKVLGGSHAL